MSDPQLVSVQHMIRDGWHTFTSPQLPGLFVTGPEHLSDEALRSLPETISALVHADTAHHVTTSYVGIRYSSPEDKSSQVLDYVVVPILL